MVKSSHCSLFEKWYVHVGFLPRLFDGALDKSDVSCGGIRSVDVIVPVIKY